MESAIKATMKIERITQSLVIFSISPCSNYNQIFCKDITCVLWNDFSCRDIESNVRTLATHILGFIHDDLECIIQMSPQVNINLNILIMLIRDNPDYYYYYDNFNAVNKVSWLLMGQLLHTHTQTTSG